MANVDAPGFSQNQQRRVADLVLAQRGGLRKLAAALTQDGFAWQALCLRLAMIKCHARVEIDDSALHLRRDGRVATLHFGVHWAQAQPRTLHLLQEEALAWSRQGGLSLVLTD